MDGKGEDVCGLYEHGPRRQTRHDNLIIESIPYSGPERSNLHLRYTANWQQSNIIPHVPPKFPRYSSQEQRLRTYKDLSWPVGLQQRPEQLSEAGFYYLGKL